MMDGGREGRLAAAGAAGAVGAAAAALALRRLREARSDGGSDTGPRAFRLRPGEPIGFGLRRVARGRLRSALRNLRDPRLGEVDAVHDARKDLKKLRSVLRLVRPVIGEEVYGRENARYRDAARLLSPVRDRQVRGETIAGLAERFRDEPPAGGWPAVERALGPAGDAPAAGALRREAAARIEGGGEALAALGLPGSDAEILGAGLRRTYARGRRRLRQAEAEPTEERLHALRKRAKDLWYHLRLVAPACAPALDPLTARTDRLCELLGAEHDLAVFAAWLAGDGAGLEAAPREDLQRLIRVRRLELQLEVFDCAETIYHERPRAFASRVVGLWQTATE
jgi:CHAD domain-containing protein